MNQQLPLLKPLSLWTLPVKLPSLKGARLIGLDVETYDPNLFEFGPGGVRKDGKLVGISIATDTGICNYFPIDHEGGGNLNKEKVLQWAKNELSQSKALKIGANLLYDLEWLRAYGIEVSGPFYDIQVAEPLIDEERELGYSLDALSKLYLDKGKDETLLKEAASAYNVDPKGGLWKLPSHYVGPYAEMDAKLPIEIYKKQIKILEEEQLMPVFELESRLIPLLLDMRFKGVRIDVDKAEQLNTNCMQNESKLLNEVRDLSGLAVEPWSSLDLQKACDKLGIWYPKTQAENPSFTSDFLNEHKNNFLQKIGEYRKVNKMRRDFIDGVCLKMNKKGRIYTQFHQLRKDSDGTRSGRFSSSNPNLQQIPARDPEWGPIIRSLFLPEKGCNWFKLDYSQQEPRVLVHYAVLREISGADEAKKLYHKDPDADFHQMVADMANIDRKVAKTINLGIMYGMGIYKLGQLLNMSYENATALMEQYHQKVPFIRGLMHECNKTATYRGWLKTLTGRKRHFNFWEPSDFKNKWPTKEMPLRRQEAEKIWKGRPLQRAYTYKALNALIQGASADMTKLAMVNLYEKLNIVPHLQVHDELDLSEEDDKMIIKIKKEMETCVNLQVPLQVDIETGKNWGELKSVVYN